MATLFQIVEARPTYCQITDGIIGTSYHRLPMTYHNRWYAGKLAGRIGDVHYEACGDSSYFVVEADQPVLSRLGRPNRVAFPVDAVDECPF